MTLDANLDSKSAAICDTFKADRERREAMIAGKTWNGQSTRLSLEAYKMGLPLRCLLNSRFMPTRNGPLNLHLGQYGSAITGLATEL